MSSLPVAHAISTRAFTFPNLHRRCISCHWFACARISSCLFPFASYFLLSPLPFALLTILFRFELSDQSLNVQLTSPPCAIRSTGAIEACYGSSHFPAPPYTASKPRKKEIHHREPCVRQSHIDRLPSSKLHSPDSCFFHPGLSGLLLSLSSTSRRTRIHSPLPSSSSPPASHIHITSVYARYTHLSNILPRTFTPSA